MSTFRLPDLGEGLAEAEIVEWHVKVGDQVRVDQPMVSHPGLINDLVDSPCLMPDALERSANNKGLPLALAYLHGNDIGKSTFHQGASLTWTDQLVARNGKEVIHEITVKVGVAILIAGQDFRFEVGQTLDDLPPGKTMA